MDHFLGVDAGTTAFKAALFDERGNERAVSTREYQLTHPGPDRVELEAETYWEACKSVIRAVLASWGGKPRQIRAISIASQGETLVPVDGEGRALRPAIVWLDNRAAAEAGAIASAFGAGNAFSVTGQPDVVPTWPAAKILWLRKHEPDVFARTRRYLLLEDYLIHRLSGRFVAEGSLLSSTLYFDIRSGGWWSDMLDFIGISPDRLPEIVPSGTVVGELTDEAAKETGLDKETRVVTGALDQAASTIGAGNVGFDAVTETTGSVLALCANVERPVFDPGRRIPCHYHAIPGAYFLLPWCQTAGMVYKWHRDQFHAGAGFEQMDEEASRVPPGSDGLVLLPHLAGAFTPESNPRARGVYFGISLQTTRAHFTRAILESVAFMLRRNLELLLGLGAAAGEIRSLGGGSRSPLWRRIKADVCQKPVVTMRTPETTSLGVAMLASVALGAHADIREAARKMSRPRERIEPDPAHAGAYARAFARYVRLYEAVEPLF
jgi:xylulokinase